MTTPSASEIHVIDQEMVELALLLPREQAAALEAEARQRGLTTGQMLRRIIQACLRTVRSQPNPS